MVIIQSTCKPVVITVIQNNTGMHSKESSQQTFKIPNNNLNVRFERAYQHHNNEILQTRKNNNIGHNL